MAAHAAFGMLSGVDRPALAAAIPTRRRPHRADEAAAPPVPAILLDVGASVECRPHHLLQFAVMGRLYARVAFDIESPRVGLLSIGEEASKGNELTREAHRLLKASSLSFIGNVEARDVYSGAADVIVCDGFTGNVALKTSEGLVEVMEEFLGEALSSTVTTRVGSLLTRRALRHFRRRRSTTRIAAARRSSAWRARRSSGTADRARKAVRNAVAMAYRFAAQRYIERVEAGHRRRRGVATVIAFIFPGQGSQKAGMGRALAEAYPICRHTFEEADAALGEPLSTTIFEGPDDKLTLTENAQPAILTVSTAAFRLLESRGVRPAFVAGHSLGEYSANVAAGTFALADAVALVRRRGQYMQEAVPVGEGAMAAILGLDADKVAEACRAAAAESGQCVTPANLNGGGQVAIAGARDAVALASEKAKALGARRAIPLPVSAPFHCALMKPAEDRLAPELRALASSAHDPRIPIVANVDAQPKRDRAAAIEALVRQVSSPVLWESVVERLASEGVTTYVEVGPGTVLGGLVKKIRRDATILNFGSPDDLEAVERTLA
jgi:[acyl-carrier-protein] S-malonyltransferase